MKFIRPSNQRLAYILNVNHRGAWGRGDEHKPEKLDIRGFRLCSSPLPQAPKQPSANRCLVTITVALST